MSEGNTAHVWVVRAGKHGEDEQAALAQGLAIIGFREVADLDSYKSFEDLVESLLSIDPESNLHRARNFARQLRSFQVNIKEGDIVVLPLKSQPGHIALGRIAGPYRFANINGTSRHTRKVNWILPTVQRSAFQQDLLYSFGAFMTVCRIIRNDAEQRVLKVLRGASDPGYSEFQKDVLDQEPMPTEARYDIALAAHDEITAFVRKSFPSHDMARLVNAILQANGFTTFLSPPGPDGGADILAASGLLGLDAPKLCVQVKAIEAAADVNVFRALQGTMSSFKASQGLLVCWGGFTQAVKNEARQHTFSIRLWDQNDLIQAIYRTYEKLPEEIQTELPLKRIWTLVHEDSETGE